jgi:hypothetical protein
MCIKQIPTLWNNKGTTSTVRSLAVSGEELQSVITMSTGTLSAFGQEGDIFSICCRTGEFLLHFLKVILAAIAYHYAKATFTMANCGLSGHQLGHSPLGQTGCGRPCRYSNLVSKFPCSHIFIS